MTIAETSARAAASMQPIIPSLRERVYDYIKSQGLNGATIDQCAIALGIRTASVCGRFNELKGGIYGDGDTVRDYPIRIYHFGEIRKTASGRSALVWIAK